MATVGSARRVPLSDDLEARARQQVEGPACRVAGRQSNTVDSAIIHDATQAIVMAIVAVMARRPTPVPRTWVARYRAAHAMTQLMAATVMPRGN